MASTPTLAACSAIFTARLVVAAPTCMMLFVLPLFWSAAHSAIRLFSSSSSKMLSPVPPATQKPWTPDCMLNSITALNAVSLTLPSSDMGVIIAG